ncbi:MAG: universal stress protein [Burkholderiales bacterium]|nr:universal stress protein [Burkholderiales bacterium]
MYATAVLALDLSPAADALLACAAHLPRWGVRRLVLVHVTLTGYGQEPGERALAGIAEWLDAQANPLRRADLRVDIAVRAAGSPAAGILAEAGAMGADLLVVGSRSRNMVSRIFLGSVASDLVRRTEFPLLLQWLEPNGDATAGCTAVCADALRHVLLATDLSRHAASAERAAVQLAPAAPIVDCLVVLTPDAVAATPALPLMVRAAADALRARIEAAGGRGEALVLAGDPHEAIARVARERDCSLIVCGKHGRNWIERKVIGGTALRLCEAAGRPVLLVPHMEAAGSGNIDGHSTTPARPRPGRPNPGDES